MAVTIKTGIAGTAPRRGRRGETASRVLFGVDFGPEIYQVGGERVELADVGAVVRASPVLWFDPRDHSLKSAAADEPVLYDPRGRKGLYLAGGGWGLHASTGGMSGNRPFEPEWDETQGILQVYGGPDARVSVSGNIVPVVAGTPLLARPLHPLYVRFTPNGNSRNFIVTPNEHVDAWRLSNGQSYEDFGRTSVANNIGDPARFDFNQDCVALLNNTAVFTIRGRMRFPGHLGVTHSADRVLNIEDDPRNRIGFGIADGIWRLMGQQNVATPNNPARTWHAPLTRYVTAKRQAQNIEFALRVDKVSGRAQVRTSLGRENLNFKIPDMGPFIAFSVGKYGAQNPTMVLDYLIVEESSGSQLSGPVQRYSGDI